MQVMPATARWTARKIGLNGFTQDQIADRDTNIAIGTGYLKLVLDSFEGSMPLAAAAYNAGPSRSRRWRAPNDGSGPVLEGAIWAENVPFNELFNPDGTMKEPAVLRARFSRARVTPDKPVVTSCGTGVTACILTLGLVQAGFPEAAVYGNPPASVTVPAPIASTVELNSTPVSSIRWKHLKAGA
jgi:hypothetical protein